MSSSSSAVVRLAALTALALWAAPALAQAPAGKAPARAAAKQAAPPAHLWWNDPDVVASLSLSAEQRKKMDQIFEKDPRTAPPGAPGAAAKERAAYFAALRAGDVDGARQRLAEWAELEGKELRATGALRIEVLSVLTPDQRKRAAKLPPGIIGVPWVERASWRPQLPRPPERPPGAQGGPQAQPAPTPAAKPPAD